MVSTGSKRREMKFLGRNLQKLALESRFSIEKWKKTEASENGHFRVGNLEGRSAGPILGVKMVPQVTGSNCFRRNFFSQTLA